MENKNQAQQRQDNDMARDHVGEKTNAEREGFGEETEDLDYKHQRDQPERQPMRDQALNVMNQTVLADPGEIDQHEGRERQGGGNGDIAGRGGAPRDHPQEVAK